jgi:hypothetical protein
VIFFAPPAQVPTTRKVVGSSLGTTKSVNLVMLLLASFASIFAIIFSQDVAASAARGLNANSKGSAMVNMADFIFPSFFLD